MPSNEPPGEDTHEARVNQALERIRVAKQAQTAARSAASPPPAPTGFLASKVRLDASLFALAWQGLALFALGLLVGIGLHVLVTVALG